MGSRLVAGLVVTMLMVGACGADGGNGGDEVVADNAGSDPTTATGVPATGDGGPTVPAGTATSTTVPSGSSATTAAPGSATSAATTGPEGTPATMPTAGGGTVAVQLEDVGGVFIEGFEIGLRFERADGTVIASTLWTDFVASLDDDSIDAYYDSVLEQPVPPGPVVVWASANVGIGPGPEVPDLDGSLRCRLDVDVPPGGTVRVEVGFSDSDRCLTIVPS